MKTVIAAVTAIIALLFTACSGGGTVGKTMPPLEVEWLGAKPNTNGKIMVVEFWATWCPPCRQSIPHLNELHAKYKDSVAIIGITNEDKATVTAFRRENPMHYSVATQSSGALGRALGVRGIPRAFLVGAGGKILWEGHPMQLTAAEIAKAL